MGTLRTKDVAAARHVGIRAIVRAVARDGAPRPDQWPPTPGTPWQWTEDRPDVVVWLTPPARLAELAGEAQVRHGSQAAAARAAGVDMATWRRVRAADGWSRWKTALAVTRAAKGLGDDDRPPGSEPEALTYAEAAAVPCSGGMKGSICPW